MLSIHKEEDFKKAFEGLLREAYKDLFELHGDKVWEMDGDELVHYFRQTDQTSAAIGQRQARVFQTFGAIAGHGEIEVKAKTAVPAGDRKSKKVVTKKPKKKKLRHPLMTMTTTMPAIMGAKNSV